MVTKARSTLSWVFSVFKTRDGTVMTTLYKSLVRSTLEYCCPLWNPGKVTDIQLIEGVQRTFTSRISGLQHLNYWERLARLKLMSLQRRRERDIILMMWKILHNILTKLLPHRLQNDIKTRHYSCHPSAGKVKLLEQPDALRPVFCSARAKTVEQGT